MIHQRYDLLRFKRTKLLSRYLLISMNILVITQLYVSFDELIKINIKLRKY